ncbi:MAG: DUF167 domain-containing protein [SAR324 cluster bacterium]|uniref:UPF0235 protein GYA55_05200 n=1 Tax=SAR324 cluster bacterium TaxID=2024889 RepID=A0A7X9IIZ3_9DELT|nr:DUF167 domain-containing protein [SAR324 cluster bacterium]
MKEMPSYLENNEQGAVLHLKVTPRCTKTGPLSVLGASLKWGVHSAAADGKANAELVESLAKFFKRSKSSVIILRGQTSRDKLVLLESLASSKVIESLDFYFAHVRDVP